MVMVTIALKKQYDYYVEHESELLAKYDGKYLVITDKMDVYPFNTGKEAYRYGTKNAGAGKFLLHKCETGSLDVVHSVNCYLPNA